jgi:hypothetical protein
MRDIETFLKDKTESELEFIAEHNSNPEFRIAAINKISPTQNQYECKIERGIRHSGYYSGVYFGIAWARTVYVEVMFTLKRIAEHDPNPEVRRAAINKLLSEENRYEQKVERGERPSGGWARTVYIEIMFTLKRIAEHDSDSEVRRVAINKLTPAKNENLPCTLRRIAINDKDELTRKIALLKLQREDVPPHLLKSALEIKREGLGKAENEGKDVCWDCLSIEPARCRYCGRCMNCVGGYYRDICTRCDYDDDD